jgi:hypothetical protein
LISVDGDTPIALKVREVSPLLHTPARPFRNFEERSMGNAAIATLGDALPKEMARVRDEILPEYIRIGRPGAMAAAMMQEDLDEAAKAITDGDTVKMVQLYNSLKEYSL